MRPRLDAEAILEKKLNIMIERKTFLLVTAIAVNISINRVLLDYHCSEIQCSKCSDFLKGFPAAGGNIFVIHVSLGVFHPGICCLYSL